MLSRRALLAGGAGVGALGVGIGLSTRVRLGRIATPSPGADAWPLGRYDAGNTAANVAASPPAEPSADWRSGPVGTGGPPALVADGDRVYASRTGGTVAFGRSGGQRRWDADVGGSLALSGDALYVGPRDARGDGPRLRALGAGTGERRWDRSTRSEGERLLATPDVVLFGGEAGVAAFGPGGDGRRWIDDRFGEAVPVVLEGRVAAVSGQADGDAGHYRQRRVADVPTGSRPGLAWRVDHDGPGRAVAADGGGLVCGFRSTTERADAGGPGWTRLDPGGTVDWRAVEPSGGNVAVGPLAVADGRCVAAVSRGGTTGSRVAARRLGDGGLDWEVEFAAGVTDLAVAGGTVLVGLDTLGLVALSLTGETRWRVDLPATPAQLAPVDGTVFVASPAGQVLALR